MSKELETLERHRKSIDDLLDNGSILPELHYVFMKDLDIIEKGLKALEFIKKKLVSLDDLSDAIYEDNYHQNNKHNAIDIYNQNRFEYKQLTQEEIDLLKEVFNL